MNFLSMQIGMFTDGKFHMLPTGELIVLNAGNADSYSSYQCRATHRLSGETKASTGVARIAVTEARAVSPPQFSERSISIEARRDELVVLPCIADGHPPPDYRYSRLKIRSINFVSIYEFLTAMNTNTPVLCAALAQSSSYSVQRRKKLMPTRQLPIYQSTWYHICTTSQKVADSIPDRVIGVFHCLNLSGRTWALGSTQPVAEMNTRDLSWGKGGRWVGLTTLLPSCTDCLEILGTSASWTPGLCRESFTFNTVSIPIQIFRRIVLPLITVEVSERGGRRFRHNYGLCLIKLHGVRSQGKAILVGCDASTSGDSK